MSRGKKTHKGKTHSKSKKAAESTPKKSTFPLKLIKNIAILIGVVLLVNGLKTYNPGYKWVSEVQVLKSQEQLEKFKDLTYQQKMEAKLGFTVRYFDFLKQNTPDTAIILFPPDTVLRPAGQVHYTKTAMNGYSSNRNWVSYFLYPRKIVYEDRLDEYPELTKGITHVAIISYWGYEKLPYRVGKKNEYSVMPIQIPR